MTIRALASAAIAGALCVPASAGATIVPQRGMAGVSLLQSLAAVRAKLGPPLKVKKGTNDFGPYTILIYRGLELAFQGGETLTSISTTARAERTVRGVGVGSSEAEVRAKVPGVRCGTESGFRHCSLGRFVPGARVTDFFLRKGHVVRVVVGIVID